jgi:lipoprotein NlpI
MSFILDALRKSEQERKTKAASKDADIVSSEPLRGRRFWPWIAGGIVLPAAVGLTAILWHPRSDVEPSSAEVKPTQQILQVLDSLEDSLFATLKSRPKTITSPQPSSQLPPGVIASLPPPAPKPVMPPELAVESMPPSQPNVVEAAPTPTPIESATIDAPPLIPAKDSNPPPQPKVVEAAPALPPVESAPTPTPTDATPVTPTLESKPPPQPKVAEAIPAPAPSEPAPTPTDSIPVAPTIESKSPPQSKVAEAPVPALSEPAPTPTPTVAAPPPTPSPDLSKIDEPKTPIRVRTAAVPASKVMRVTGTPLVHVKRGQAYEDEGLLDRALEEYTQAILLEPNFAEAYLGRGWIHHAKGSRRLAIKNFSQAIRLKPRNPEAFFGRAWAYEQMGQVDLAIKEYGQAIHLKDDYADAYLSRGILRFYHDRPEAAAADFGVVLDKAPDELRRYALLWLFLSRARSGGNGLSELSALAETVSLTPWPGIIVTHYLGKSDAEHVLAAITDEDPKTRLEKECVAYYFLGQYYLVHGDRKRAAEQFRKTLATGVRGYRQYGAAEKELRRMGETP